MISSGVRWSSTGIANVPIMPAVTVPRRGADLERPGTISSITAKRPTAEPLMNRFRSALYEAYGDRIERIVLYGSRARGDARPDSDYDVAIFLKNSGSFWEEAGRIATIETDILCETGAVIHAIPFRAGAIHECRALMHEIRGEGVDL